MPTYRVVLSIPATLYAYHDIKADSHEALKARLDTQGAIDDIVANGEGFVNDIAEPEDRFHWAYSEIGSPSESNTQPAPVADPEWDDSFGDHPQFTLEDWAHEVCSHETRMGYRQWVAHKIEAKD